MAYGLLGLNFLYYLYFTNRSYSNRPIHYAALFINLGLIGAILYFTIDGYNKSNACAPTRMLYELFFIETMICLVLLGLILFAQVAWADRYANWPANLAWPILFLKQGFPEPWSSPALAIGILFIIVCVSSFIVNAIYYRSYSKNNIVLAQWTLAIVISIGCEILAIVMLLKHGGGDYWAEYARKLFVAFAAVNLIDLAFWGYGYRRI